jgi:hypothetical protein
VLALVAVEELGPVVCGQGVVASCFIFCSDLVRSGGLGSLPLDRSGIWRRRRLDAAWGPFDRGRCGGSPLCGAGGLDARWCLRSDGCYTRRDWCCILDWRRWCSKRWVGFGRFCGWPSVRLGVGQGRVLMTGWLTYGVFWPPITYIISEWAISVSGPLFHATRHLSPQHQLFSTTQHACYFK